MSNPTSPNGHFTFVRERCNTLQGRVYDGNNVITGKSVAIKEAFKKCVEKRIKTDGKSCKENFLKEREILSYLSNLPNFHKSTLRINILKPFAKLI